MEKQIENIAILQKEQFKIKVSKETTTALERQIDLMVYKKYGLSEEEITFIESMIKPME